MILFRGESLCVTWVIFLAGKFWCRSNIHECDLRFHVFFAKFHHAIIDRAIFWFQRMSSKTAFRQKLIRAALTIDMLWMISINMEIKLWFRDADFSTHGTVVLNWKFPVIFHVTLESLLALIYFLAWITGSHLNRLSSCVVLMWIHLDPLIEKFISHFGHGYFFSSQCALSMCSACVFLYRKTLSHNLHGYVMRFNVSLSISRAVKNFLAKLAFIALLNFWHVMSFHVSIQCLLIGIRHMAAITFQCIFTMDWFLMPPKRNVWSVSLFADIASKDLVVFLHMIFKFIIARKTQRAFGAFKRINCV